MARSLEIDDNPTQGPGGAVRLTVLALLTFGIAGYLLVSGCQQQAPERSSDAYCRHIGAVASFDKALADLDPAAASADLAALEQLHAVAPPEIEPQVRVLLDTSRPVVNAISRAKGDEQAVETVWRAKQADLARIEAAGKAVQAYTLATCKIDLGTSLPRPGATSTSAPPPTPAPTMTAIAR